MPRSLKEKADTMPEPIGNANKEIEILRKKQREMLKIKNIAKEMKKDF